MKKIVKVINCIRQVDEHGETALIIASCLGKTEVLSSYITTISTISTITIITITIIINCLVSLKVKTPSQICKIKGNKRKSSNFQKPKRGSFLFAKQVFCHLSLKIGRKSSKNTLYETNISDVINFKL